MSAKKKEESTELVQSTRVPTWPALIPEIVKRRHFHCVQQTPTSAKELHDTVGYFCDDKIMPHEVESTLFEAFIEDDYDGKLRLTTIHNEQDTLIGLIFWREVPEEEMKEWINYQKLAQVAKTWQQGKAIEANGTLSICTNQETRAGAELLGIQSKDASTSSNQTESENGWKMNAVRRASLTWLARMEESHYDANEDSTHSSAISRAHTSITNPDVPPDYAQKWIKIELLAVRPPWWGQRVGSLLLACSMYQAWLCNNARVVLHVAGGTANVPAVRLYERFGFVPAPGIFHKPDKDIYVLGNIGLALQSLAWSQTLEQDKDKAIR